MPKPEELAAKEAALQQQEASFAEREQRLKTQEIAVRHGKHLSFAEGLIKEGRLLPVQKDQAVAMLDFASSLEAGNVIEFGEGDAKQTLALGESMKTFLLAQPKFIEFGEVVKPEGDVATVEFAAAPGFTVDAANLEIHNKALAYQALNPGVDYMAAVRAVQ